MDNRFVVMTEYYKSYKKARYKEIFRSIAANCRHPNIKKVVLFMAKRWGLPAELEQELTSQQLDKIEIYRIDSSRSSYSDFFAYANESLVGKNCILCNNDISFDNTLVLPDTFDLSGHFVCLTRWDIQKGNNLSFKKPARTRKSTQDAWMFTPKLPDKMVEKGGFYMGKPGCDNMVAYLATISGLKIMNPSQAIKARHYHMSGHRNYSPRRDRLGGDPIYMHVYPHDLVEYIEDKVMYRGYPQGTEHKGKKAIDIATERERANENSWWAALKKGGKK